MRKIAICLAAAALMLAQVSCGTRLESGDGSMEFVENDGAYGLSFRYGGEALSFRDRPVTVNIKDPSGNALDDHSYSVAYSSVRKAFKSVIAEAEVLTDGGSRFSVEDRWSLRDGAFVVHRKLKVRKAASGDSSFSSAFVLDAADQAAGYGGWYYFIPGILYGDGSQMRDDAIGADLSVEKILVKETRSGLPLAMLRDKSSGLTFTLAHYHPEITVGDNPEGGVPGEANDAIQYGSIGYGLGNGLSVEYRYPCLEGPVSYEPGLPRMDSWTARYHPVTEGFAHEYELAVLAGSHGKYTDAMQDTFSRAYMLQQPEHARIDMEDIYQDNIDIFKAEYRNFGSGGFKSPGLPWSLDLPDGTNREGISYQMGFVGQQIAVAYHLYRYGKDNGDDEAVKMGVSIVDFWTSDVIMGTFFPTVWWDPADNETAGRRRDYPSFLRCFVDGMEGLLDACRISEAYGDRHERWENALVHVAENLLSKQNADGSFCRAYRPDGSVEAGGDRNTFGESRLNTPVAVRFLVKMYEYTGEEKYKESAVRAAEFAYSELYEGIGKYVGGTPDNPNTVDKEAAIFAMYAFNAAHDVTGDEKFLKAACHAAISAVSWTYCYDYAIPHRNDGDRAVNPFGNGGVIGFSLISSGHSHADNFISYISFELYKLYVKTGEVLYLDMADFIANDSKLSSDYDGRMGYKYRAFLPEATNVADFAFRSVSLWLPWSSIANIEPLVQLEEAFGQKNIKDIRFGLPELRKRLAEYGTGGKPMKR